MPAALAIGAIGSAAIGAKGARDAGKAQERATRTATDAQERMYQQTRADLAPFRDTGTSAFQAYASELGLGSRPAGFSGYETSPMARYLLEKNTEGINAAFAARGGFNSGAALQALEEDRRRVVTADRDSFLDRLGNLGAAGQNAATQTGQFGMQTAGNIGNLAVQGGTAQANAILGGTQAIQSGIGDLAGIYGYFSSPMAAFANSTNARAPISSMPPPPRPAPPPPTGGIPGVQNFSPMLSFPRFGR